MKSPHVLLAFVSLMGITGALSAAGAAIVVDGTLDSSNGPPAAFQNVQTNMGDNAWMFPDQANGSELDAAYGIVDGTTLYLFFTGNLIYYPQSGPPAVGDFLSVFIDSKPGGQNVLLANNPVIPPGMDMTQLAGLEFDNGFAPDYYMGCGGRGYPTWPPLRVFWADLPTAGGGAGSYLGYSTPGGPGTLTGGANTINAQAAINNMNVGGVNAGCGASSGYGPSTGIEVAIPLAAIGNPAGCIGVTAFIGNTYQGNQIGNQVLGSLPAGSCNLGAASGVNFAAIPGNQYFTICLGPVAARPAAWGALKLMYR